MLLFPGLSIFAVPCSMYTSMRPFLNFGSSMDSSFQIIMVIFVVHGSTCYTVYKYMVMDALILVITVSSSMRFITRMDGIFSFNSKLSTE